MGRIKVMTGCRDCQNCTNSSFEHGARKAGRRTAAVVTLGVSELGMGMTGKCRLCGHQMSLHRDWREQQAAVLTYPTPAPAPAVQGPPPGWYADPAGSGHLRWWDGLQWTVLQPHPPASAPPAPPAPAPTPAAPLPPAGWHPDPAGSGRQRWWDGARWTENYHPATS